MAEENNVNNVVRDDKEIEKQEVEKGVIGAEITEEMEKAYIDYAMSVIVSRALPSVEDGLKPVQRRILYAMNAMGLKPGSQTKKSARIVGDTMGKFHPHGDTAIYDALVRLAQPFSLRYPLIKGQGNFGSLDGDPPAAMRYTEAKLQSISEELLQDIDKDTVKFLPNFDNSTKEPETLPGKLPNLLLNGASGIAVGMATNIPPHNLSEVCDGIIAYIENPEIDVKKLLNYVKGPDFPTGGSFTCENLEELYRTGRGKIIMRGKTNEEESKGKKKIVITEIPYMLNKADLITSIAKLVSDKKLPAVADIRDESSKGNIRIVIELRKGQDSKFTLNRLYKNTRLQDSFDANIIALVKNIPKLLGLKEIIKEYVNYRKLIIERRSRFELKKAEDRLEIVQGLLIALKDIDKIIELIKKASHVTDAKEKLIKNYKLSIKQAEAILEIKLSALTRLEQDKLNKEEKELKEKIDELKKILGSEKLILGVVRKDILELKRKYGDNRRTSVLEKIREIKEKDLVQKKDVVISITDKGYVKRIDSRAYKEQKRGGKGVIGSDLATGDFIKELLTCSTHDYLLFFTSKGRVYWLKAYQVPEIQRYGKGRALINLLNLKDEVVSSILPVSEFKDYLIFVTKQGQCKKLNLELLSKPRSNGVRIMNLPSEDSLVDVRFVKNKQEVLLISKKGQAIRFNSDDIRSMGRGSYGVTGIKLDKNDEVVSLEVIPLEKSDVSVLTITDKGYGKRSKIEDYRLTNRAGKGVINLKISDKTGEVVKTVSVLDKDSVIVSTQKGMIIRCSVKDLRVMGRATQGVHVVRLQQGDKVADLVKVNEVDE